EIGVAGAGLVRLGVRAQLGSSSSIGVGAALLALGSSAWAANVPPSGALTAQSASSRPAATSPRTPIAYPLRVRNPAQYTRAKATANQAYSRWTAAHPSASIFSSPLTVSLGQPGMNANVDGNGLTPPD